MKKFALSFFVIIFTFSSVSAQYRRSTERQCILCSFDFGAGWYQPSLDYWNNESYLSEIEGSFDGGLMFTASAEMKIYQGFMGGLQIGYWRDKAEVVGAGLAIANWDEEITIQIIPVTLYGKYEFTASKRLFPFLGGGITNNFINQELNREVNEVPTNEKLSGSAQTISLMAGVKFAIASHLDFGLEYNYVVGGFDQDFTEDEITTTQAVGLDGSLALAKLSLTIDDRFNQRRGRSKARPGGRRYKKTIRRGRRSGGRGKFRTKGRRPRRR